MTPGDRIARLTPWLAATLIFAGIVHLTSILLMPRVAPHDAFARLAGYLRDGGISLLPSPEPGKEVLPFLDPAFAYAACGYDLAKGPLRLKASLAPGPLVTLSFHSRHGVVFYAFTDRAALRGAIEVLVLTAPQLAEAEAQDNEDEPPQELRLLAPENEGFVLLRALARSPGETAAAQARLAGVECSRQQ